MCTPSRGVRPVDVTADTTPETVKVGFAGAVSAVGVVGALPPQAHIGTARPKANVRRFMGSERHYTPP